MFLLCTIFALCCLIANATYIGLTGILICPDPFSNVATVFLMEKDYSHTFLGKFDEDDVMAYKEVELNKPFELGGKEMEIDGLEPYIFLRYNCRKDYQEEVIYLGNTQFIDRIYYLRKNLDTGETQIF